MDKMENEFTKPNFRMLECCNNCVHMRQGGKSYYCDKDLSYETINQNSPVMLAKWCKVHEIIPLAVCDDFKSIMEHLSSRIK